MQLVHQHRDVKIQLMVVLFQVLLHFQKPTLKLLGIMETLQLMYLNLVQQLMAQVDIGTAV